MEHWKFGLTRRFASSTLDKCNVNHLCHLPRFAGSWLNKWKVGPACEQYFVQFPRTLKQKIKDEKKRTRDTNRQPLFIYALFEQCSNAIPNDQCCTEWTVFKRDPQWSMLRRMNSVQTRSPMINVAQNEQCSNATPLDQCSAEWTVFKRDPQWSMLRRMNSVQTRPHWINVGQNEQCSNATPCEAIAENEHCSKSA